MGLALRPKWDRDTDVSQRWDSYINGAEMRWNWGEWHLTAAEGKQTVSVCYLTVTVSNVHLNPHVLLQIPSPHSLTCQFLFIYKQITLINLRPERVKTMDRTPVPVPRSSPHNCSTDCDKITRRDSLETAVPWSDVKLQYDFQILAQLSHSHNPIHSPSSLSHT